MTLLARGAERWIAVACLPALAALATSAPAFAGLPGAPLSAAAPLSVALSPLPLFVAFFFRDPERTPEAEGVLSPADGRLQRVVEDDGRVTLVVFMRLRDVHVNRVPVDASVTSVEHQIGGHLPAFTKASERNERTTTTLEAADGIYEVEQVAGTVARRITTYVDAADRVERGGRLGHIAFSSRVDLTLPACYDVGDLEVGEGDVLAAGESVVASNDGEEAATADG